uniref:Uncharacterized protein n=1 Tax=Arundo donax TaxID=35708 RepID=A0A0A9G2G5_ARUDO
MFTRAIVDNLTV